MSILVPTINPDLASAPIASLLRDRVAAALQSMAPGTQRAYVDGLNRFANWFAKWHPTAPSHLAGALASTNAAEKNWWSIIVALLRSSPLIASTVVDLFKASDAAGNAPATITLRLNAVRWPFRIAYDAGLVTWQLRVRAPKVEPYRDTRGPGLKNVHRMFAILDKLNDPDVRHRDRVLLDLLFVLGLRRAEVAELDVQHFDAASQRLLVLGKGKQERVPISVPATVATDINTYLSTRSPLALDAPLVASHDRNEARGNGRLTGHGIWRRVGYLAKRAGIDVRTTPHGLRHTAITTALDSSNGNTRMVRSFSRHAKDETVGRYDDNRRDVGGQIAEQLAELVKPKAPPTGG